VSTFPVLTTFSSDKVIQWSDVMRSNNNSQVELMQNSDVMRSNNNSQVELIQKSDVMRSNNNSQVDQVAVVETDQKEMLALSISEVNNHQNLNLETESRFLSSTKSTLPDCYYLISLHLTIVSLYHPMHPSTLSIFSLPHFLF
jgi:hypothetical protein